jgi:hypothetical protein
LARAQQGERVRRVAVLTFRRPSYLNSRPHSCLGVKVVAILLRADEVIE